MTPVPVEAGPACPAELPLLTYWLQGVKLGTDADQIDAMLDMNEALSKGVVLCHLQDELGFTRDRSEYRSPMVLLLKESPGLGIVIDAPDEIVPVPVRDIRPLPELIASRSRPKAVWGVLLRDNSLVMLLDLVRIGQTAYESDRNKKIIDNNNRSQS